VTWPVGYQVMQPVIVYWPAGGARLESKVEELTEDCERMKREREGLKRQSDLEKAAHKRLAEETALKTAELARSRDQVRRLQRERLCDPLPVNEEV
jgi:hypothetical protein